MTAQPASLKRRQALIAKEPFLRSRAQIVRNIRDWFESEGFLEVETPLRIPAPAPEKYIDTEPCGDWFLIASPELQMKQLICAGYDRIFSMGHCFRKGERGPHHLSEFTMLEWYRAGETLEKIMHDCEQLLLRAANGISIPGDLDLTTPFLRMTVDEAFRRYAGWSPGPAPDQNRFDMDLVSLVEPSLPKHQPVFLYGYPRSMASLARISTDNPDTALRFELYAGGLELANAYAELNDAEEQRRRFEAEEEFRRSEGKPPYPLDESFLSELTIGMPQSCGIALGVDRLVMLLTDAPSIDHVVAFTDP